MYLSPIITGIDVFLLIWIAPSTTLSSIFITSHCNSHSPKEGSLNTTFPIMSSEETKPISGLLLSIE